VLGNLNAPPPNLLLVSHLPWSRRHRGGLVFQYAVPAKTCSLAELRTLQDWGGTLMASAVPEGVSEVASRFGGFVKPNTRVTVGPVSICAPGHLPCQTRQAVASVPWTPAWPHAGALRIRNSWSVVAAICQGRRHRQIAFTSVAGPCRSAQRLSRGRDRPSMGGAGITGAKR